MATTTDKLDDKALELALEEQRRDFDVLHSLHEAQKIKTLTFLAASLGILAYLYTGAPTDGAEHSIMKRLFIPSQAYGVVFYAAGVALLLGAIIGFLVIIVKVRQWHTAYDNGQEESLMNEYHRYLEYMHGRYLTVSRINGDCYEKRRYLLNNSFNAMILGGSILLLIKTFGG